MATILISALALTACGSDSQDSDSDSSLTTVKIHTEPYYDYKFFDVAHELGIDKEFGLNIETVTSAQQFSYQPLVRGDADIAASCPTCIIPVLANQPDLKDFMVNQEFRGFVPVGRAENGVGVKKGYDQFLEESNGDEEAAMTAWVKSLKGSSWAIASAIQAPNMRLMLAKGGLTLDDVKVIDFPNETTSALAFINGEGDYYFGSLPQTLRLVTAPELKDNFVTAGTYKLFPPAFGNFAATQKWLDENEDTALRLWAVWLRAVRYLNEQPDAALGIIAESVKEATGGLFTPEQTKVALTEFNFYPTVDEVQKTFFDADAPANYQKANAEVYGAAAASGTIPESMASGEETEVAQKYWDLLQERQDLLDLIDAPLK
ncbi:ABC transporter substrate-binding protein [Nocardioides agariphilus]|uniref:ABC transporter substrate-binding protein n=1 Tax=Nocardioides agariphilus TaxID=433664 RepID=A0A930VL77_9ACTN|nr:ABC transporter substrate-binding protein [Nocardioides agariphilus]MBF4768768.1 ABC transporter substrate-binding protein [Nocardioides agariphilus]